jgi:hypothetical protein
MLLPARFLDGLYFKKKKQEPPNSPPTLTPSGGYVIKETKVVDSLYTQPIDKIRQDSRQEEKP